MSWDFLQTSKVLEALWMMAFGGFLLLKSLTEPLDCRHINSEHISNCPVACFATGSHQSHHFGAYPVLLAEFNSAQIIILGSRGILIGIDE